LERGEVSLDQFDLKPKCLLPFTHETFVRRKPGPWSRDELFIGIGAVIETIVYGQF
jgi:hypothetical protein